MRIHIWFGLPNHFDQWRLLTKLRAYSCGDSQGLTAGRFTLFPFNPKWAPFRVAYSIERLVFHKMNVDLIWCKSDGSAESRGHI